ncbi:MAG: 3-hydroxyacyl-[acyl-carrier-protein] dehydratase FabZ [Candidatus Bruticola sp.]
MTDLSERQIINIEVKDNGAGMNLEQIKDVLPHRDPFLLVDEVSYYDGLNAACGLKKLTGQEYFFNNCSDSKPELPKPILIEIMAQLGASCVLNHPNYKGKLILFATVEECAFGKAPVVGDNLEIRVETRGMRRGVGRMRAQCLVEGELRADGLLMFAIADRD